MILISMKRAALLATIAALASIVLVFFLLGPALFTENSDESSIADVTDNKKQNASSPVRVAAGGIARFENVTNLTNNPNDSVYGQVAAAGNNVYVVWQESTDAANGRNYDIFFKRSQDQGSTFENDSITNLSKNSGFSEHPQLVTSKNSVYVVWADNTSGNKEVLFAKSADNGGSFDKAKDLSDSSSDSYNQEIAAFENNVYVVWQEQDDEGNNTIVFRASKDGGNAFEGPVILADESNGNVDPRSFPKVAAYGNAVYVVWSVTGDTDRKPGLFYVKSSDRGDTFSPITRLNGSKDVGEAQVGTYQDDVYVIWGGQDTAAVDRLFYVKSSDGGKTFTGPAGVDSATLANPLNVELAVMQVYNGIQPYFYIASQVVLSSGNDEILLVSSSDGGHTFAEAINLSNNTGISECPSIAVSGNDIFVIWEDLTAGNHEIFLSKGSVTYS
jgi:hypothetical protein